MISTTGEYALRAVVHLAQHHPSPRTAARIAEATLVPVGYLSKVLQALARAEVVDSQRGLHGGFTLASPPAEITVWEVLVAVGAQPKRITECPLGLPGHVKLCPLHRVVDEAVAHAEAAFAKATIGELSKSARGIRPLRDPARG